MTWPLIEAAAAGDVASIRQLLAGGADSDVQGDGGTTPLLAATKAPARDGDPESTNRG